MCIRETMINSWFLPAKSFWQSDPGLPWKSDFICPQAFGRNTFSDSEIGMLIYMTFDTSDSDIEKFRWLESLGFDPGRPNKMIAKRCIQTAKLVGLFTNTTTKPVIGQWEVLYAIWLNDPHWYSRHRRQCIAVWPPIEGYLTTHAMLLEVKTIAEKRGLKKPCLIAHPEHIQRCFFIAMKVFERTVAVATNHGIEARDKGWFDRQSVQRWTQDPKYWLFYEMLARIHHRFHGWI